MGLLKNYREVGKFDVLEAPRSPIGAFAAEQFKKEALELLAQGTQHLVVNIGNLDFLYSDALNALSTVQQKISAQGGSLGVLALDELAVKSMQQARLDSIVKIYRSESDMVAASVRGVILDTPKKSAVNREEPPPPEKPRSRHFTQSFNSITVDDSPTRGIADPFDISSLESKATASRTLVLFIVAAGVVATIALAWRFLM